MDHEKISYLMEKGRTLRLLYAEDDQYIREQQAKFFGRLFSEVVSASDGAEALGYYESERFDLVITDISMPKLNGLALAKAIKSLHPEQCLLFVSAFNDTEYVSQVEAFDACGLIYKPINMNDMIDKLYSVIFEGRAKRPD